MAPFFRETLHLITRITPSPPRRPFFIRKDVRQLSSSRICQSRGQFFASVAVRDRPVESKAPSRRPEGKPSSRKRLAERSGTKLIREYSNSRIIIIFSRLTIVYIYIQVPISFDRLRRSNPLVFFFFFDDNTSRR